MGCPHFSQKQMCVCVIYFNIVLLNYNSNELTVQCKYIK